MNIVTISSKNQITLPVEILQSLGIGSGEQVLVREEDKEIVLKPIKGSIVNEVAGSLTKYIDPAKQGVPFETIMEETRKLAAKKLSQK